MNDIISLLKSVNAVITNDHFVYTSGKHGSVYINKDALYPHTELASQVGRMFAQATKDLNIDIVAAPALGGIILSQWTANHLTRLHGKEILGVYTEKDDQKDQVFTRGYDTLVTGKNVLVIEDLTTTGGSVKKVVNTVQNVGGNVVQVGVMVNRDPKLVTAETVGAPFFALAELPVEAFDEQDCPFCKEGRPINTTIGHGKKYMESKQ